MGCLGIRLPRQRAANRQAHHQHHQQTYDPPRRGRPLGGAHHRLARALNDGGFLDRHNKRGVLGLGHFPWTGRGSFHAHKAHAGFRHFYDVTVGQLAVTAAGFFTIEQRWRVLVQCHQQKRAAVFIMAYFKGQPVDRRVHQLDVRLMRAPHHHDVIGEVKTFPHVPAFQDNEAARRQGRPQRQRADLGGLQRCFAHHLLGGGANVGHRRDGGLAGACGLLAAGGRSGGAAVIKIFRNRDAAARMRGLHASFFTAVFGLPFAPPVCGAATFDVRHGGAP